ncbi:MAG: DUF116 domain-containing protein [Candidatus Altiarchaeota archaeon]|nr:DUF116 domain-containing protein [Candidatus Altiarchaeota archaeon]
MQLLGFEASYVAVALLIGIAILTIMLLLAIAAAVVLGVISVYVFHKSRRVFIPKVTLFVLSFLEAPIKYALMLFRVDENVVDQMLIQIRNSLYFDAYRKTPYDKRAIFLPQCLRSPNCPAKLTPEGIKCVECGQCGIAEVKKAAESLGYLFFIVPGSSFIRRMVKKYKPEAILGVGCSMEVKEGTAMMASAGLPVQGVMLLRDGCVDTRVEVKDLMEKIRLGGGDNALEAGEVERISKGWSEQEPKFYLKVKK